MGEMDNSERYDSEVLCTPEIVIDELGSLVNRDTSTVFPNSDRDSILGRWCRQESAKFYEFVGVLHSQLAGHLLALAEEAVLYRVCVRVLRRAQVNRVAKPGGVAEYKDMIENYQNELDILEHYIRSVFYPNCGDKEEQDPYRYDPRLPYPEVFLVEVTVLDDLTNLAIVGARLFINNEWLGTTWADGETELRLNVLTGNDEAYSLQAKAPGYIDSDYTEVSEEGNVVIRMTPET